MQQHPKIAVVGTGFIGPVHVEALRRLGLHVKGILGSSPEKSAQAAEQLRLPHAYPDFESILADREIGAVHLASPNHLHRPQALAAIEAGKHVICEKPLAVTQAEAAELVEAAKARPDLVCAVNYNIRFYPMALQAKAMIAAGEIGEIIHINGSYLQDWLLYDTDMNWRVDAEQNGPLRAMGDIGTHWIDLLQFISDLKIESLIADLRTLHPVRYRPAAGSRQTFSKGDAGDPAQKGEPVKVSTEDYGALLLRFAGGARGTFTVSQIAAGRKNEVSFEIYGTRGSLRWNSERPEELTLGCRDQPNRALQRNPAFLSESAAPYSDYPAGHCEGFSDTFKQLYRAVYADIAQGRPSPSPLYATFEDGLQEMRILDAIAESHHSRAWQQL